MGTVQSTYGDMAAAVAGQIAEMGLTNVISRTVETAVIPFGAVATQGSTDNAVRPAGAGRTIFRGIAVRDRSVDATSVDQYPVGSTGGFVEKGVVWVVAGETITAGVPAYWVEATGAIVDTASGNLAIPNAIFDSAAANGALVKLRLR